MTFGSLAFQEGCFFLIQFDVKLLLVEFDFVQVDIYVWFVNHFNDTSSFKARLKPQSVRINLFFKSALGLCSVKQNAC